MSCTSSKEAKASSTAKNAVAADHDPTFGLLDGPPPPSTGRSTSYIESAPSSRAPSNTVAAVAIEVDLNHAKRGPKHQSV